MISTIIFYFLSTLSLIFYPIQTLLFMFYSLIVVYIYNKCSIKNYKTMSCLFLKLMIILFYLLDIKLVIAGTILLLLLIISISNIFNNNLLSSCDNNCIVNMLWKGNNFIINSLIYLFKPIYNYFDSGLNKLINLLTSPQVNKNKNELEKLESLLQNINGMVDVGGKVNVGGKGDVGGKGGIESIIGKMGINNKIKNKKMYHKNNNMEKNTHDLIKMFEQLNNILKDQ